MSKYEAEVQVTLRVMVTVQAAESDVGGGTDWRKLSSRAIRKVIAAHKAGQLDVTDAIAQLECDGLGYPLDFAEVCDVRGVE